MKTVLLNIERKNKKCVPDIFSIRNFSFAEQKKQPSLCSSLPPTLRALLMLTFLLWQCPLYWKCLVTTLHFHEVQDSSKQYEQIQ